MPGRHHEDDYNLIIPTLSPGMHPGGMTGREAENGNYVIASAVRASDGHHGHSSPRGDGADNLLEVLIDTDPIHDYIVQRQTAAGVRRLTPLECERLQGWPDEHTKYAADGTQIPDSHRYRMIGNGVASPCAEWIGHRLVAVNN